MSHRSSSPDLPGAWPTVDDAANVPLPISMPSSPAPAHIDQVISFHRRLSSTLSSSVANVDYYPDYPGVLDRRPTASSNMPGGKVPGDESLVTSYDTNGHLSAFGDSFNSTAYTSDSVPEPPANYTKPYNQASFPQGNALSLHNSSNEDVHSVPAPASLSEPKLVALSPPPRHARPQNKRNRYSKSKAAATSESSDASPASFTSPEPITFASPVQSQIVFPPSPEYFYQSPSLPPSSLSQKSAAGPTDIGRLRQRSEYGADSSSDEGYGSPRSPRRPYRPLSSLPASGQLSSPELSPIDSAASLPTSPAHRTHAFTEAPASRDASPQPNDLRRSSPKDFWADHDGRSQGGRIHAHSTSATDGSGRSRRHHTGASSVASIAGSDVPPVNDPDFVLDFNVEDLSEHAHGHDDSSGTPPPWTLEIRNRVVEKRGILQRAKNLGRKVKSIVGGITKTKTARGAKRNAPTARAVDELKTMAEPEPTYEQKRTSETSLQLPMLEDLSCSFPPDPWHQLSLGRHIDNNRSTAREEHAAPNDKGILSPSSDHVPPRPMPSSRLTKVSSTASHHAGHYDPEATTSPASASLARDFAILSPRASHTGTPRARPSPLDADILSMIIPIEDASPGADTPTSYPLVTPHSEASDPLEHAVAPPPEGLEAQAQKRKNRRFSLMSLTSMNKHGASPASPAAASGAGGQFGGSRWSNMNMRRRHSAIVGERKR